MSSRTYLRLTLALVISLAASAAHAAAAPLKIGYSDWPGWVAWHVAIEKGWLKEAGGNATFEWFDYTASMDAFPREDRRVLVAMVTHWSRRRRQKRHDCDRLLNGNDTIVASRRSRR
jgi:hypothetical protein